MISRSSSIFVACSAAFVVCILATGCTKDENAADSSATPVNTSAGAPAALPDAAPPVVTEQIKGSQEAGAAMQAEANKRGADYNAARAKAQ